MKHPAPELLARYPVCQGQLCPGGRPVSEWAEQHGTPLYLYDRRVIAARIGQLRAAMPSGLSLYYAVKANPLAALLEWLAPRVDGMDVASGGELRAALDAGLDGRRISFAGPGKRDEELAAAIEAGALLSVESPGELTRLAALAGRLGKTPRLALRINPGFRLRASGMHMGGGPSPFGIDQEQAPAVLEQARALGLEPCGLHVFAGSQNLSLPHLLEAQRAIFELAFELAPHFPGGMEWLNIGGGLGIPYFAGEQALDPAPLGEQLDTLMQQARTRLGGPEVVLELGRYLVGEAGIYLCRIIDRKVSRGRTWLITDGGMHHHLAASGNFGQVLRRPFPLVLANRVQAPPGERVNVVGPLCTPLDRLGEQVELPHAEPGDLIAVLQSGAYGLSASPRGFLSHPEPVELLV